LNRELLKYALQQNGPFFIFIHTVSQPQHVGFCNRIRGEKTMLGLIRAFCFATVFELFFQAQRLKPLTFASTIAHINDMFARDPALSRVITRNKVGHV
jgi:hypothetical protein